MPIVGHAQRLQPLAGDEADAAGGRVKQDGVAGFDLVGPRDQVLTVIPLSIIAAAVSDLMPSGIFTRRAAGTLRASE